jgi:GDPmannose 4,6-dehydratase
MRTALITGITGQTGSYLCDQLLEAGWRVHGMVRDADDLEPEFRRRSPGAELHHGELADPQSLKRVVASTRPTAIFNLGGLTSVAQSFDQPELTARITGVAVAVLLDAALALHHETGERVSFVQASSAEMFGAATEIPQNESTPIRPVSPYGAAKAYAHHLVGVYRGLGLAATSCILYNHESPRRPPQFVTRKITAGVARIAAGLGDSLTLGNLDAARDWGWAPDYARALTLAAEGDPGDYVIATGEAHTVRDFVDAAFAAAGISDWSHLVRQDPAFLRPQDAPTLVGDATLARRVLGWSPSVEFGEIVARMVAADTAILSANPPTHLD